MSLDPITADGRFLHGEDLRNKDGWFVEVTLTVKCVGDRDSEKDESKRAIPGWPVYFEERDKILILNRTNTKLGIAAMGTKQREEWAGRKLTLYAATLKKCFGQTNVVCIRVRVPAGRPKPFIMPEHLGTDLTEGGRDAKGN